jgi:hypothetical protein
MTAALNINSYGLLIRNVILERCKLIPPFTSVARFSRTTAKAIQAEHIPYLGIYYEGETFTERDANQQGEPKFKHRLKIGFSYIVQNNDPELAEELADAGHWSIMKLFHDPNWHRWPASMNMPKAEQYMIESVIGGECDHVPGNAGRNNETPVLELQMSLMFTYSTIFPPLVTDPFESLHFVADPKDPDVRPIIADWTIPTARYELKQPPPTEDDDHG